MASHANEQESIDNFKYFWKKGGVWVLILLVVAALAYLGYVLYQSHQENKNQEAITIYNEIVEKKQSNENEGIIKKDLENLRLNFAHSIATSQAVMLSAVSKYDKNDLDGAIEDLKWILEHQKDALVRAISIINLASVYLEQKKYEQALEVLNMQVDPTFESMILDAKADVYLAQGNKEQAIASYKQALKNLNENTPQKSVIQTKLENLE